MPEPLAALDACKSTAAAASRQANEEY